MSTFHFDSDTCNSLAHHLRVAAIRYDEDARNVGQHQLAKQFERQAVEARELAARFENMEELANRFENMEG